MCHGSEHILNVGHCEPLAMLLSAATDRLHRAGCVFRRLQTSARASSISCRLRARLIAAAPAHLQNQPHSSKVLIMPPTEVAVPVLAPVIPSFTQAAMRFAVCFAALIGLSPLLAGL